MTTPGQAETNLNTPFTASPAAAPPVTVPVTSPMGPVPGGSPKAALFVAAVVLLAGGLVLLAALRDGGGAAVEEARATPPAQETQAETPAAVADPAPPLVSGQITVEVVDQSEPPKPALLPVREYAGPVESGLQLVARADRYRCLPGDVVNFTLKFVNRGDEPIRFCYENPEVHVVRSYSAKKALAAETEAKAKVYADPKAPAARGQVRELAPGGVATYTYAFTWPAANAGALKTRGALVGSGVSRVTLVYNATRLVPPSGLSEQTQPLWEGQVRSGLMTFITSGRSAPRLRPSMPVDEDF